MSERADALRARLLATFRVEAEEHLRSIRSELDATARASSPDDVPEMLETILRTMHTLKGAARSVGLERFELACHRCEALLSALVRNGSDPDPKTIRLLQDASDVLAGAVSGTIDSAELERLALGPDEEHQRLPQAVESSPADHRVQVSRETIAPPDYAETIRVEVGRLDRLVTLTESLLSPKLAAAEHVHQARGIAEEIERIRVRVSPESLDLREELRSLESLTRQFLTKLRAESRTLQTTVDDLYEEMRRVRMMPAASLFEAFPLMVRDLCRETGKEADWQLAGADLEVDRKVLELVKDPLIHLVRNAVDHGIEAPPVREAAGKPRRGSVCVTLAPLEGGRISIEVGDDGRGFAIDAIRDAAVRSHLTTADQAAMLSESDVAELAFSSGVSTAPVVTSISGHGRGLVIVRERIERIEGRISTRSSAGAGTVIRMELPASIVTYRALLVGVEGDRFLLPLDSIERVFSVPRRDLLDALSRGLLSHADRALPVGSLGAILGLPATGAGHADRLDLPCVLVQSGERRGVLQVDEVIGEHEIVIKDLRPPLQRVRNVLAAGLLGTGDLVLVLRPLDVLTSIHSRPPAERKAPSIEERRVVRILVVDDSITTRTMERNLFEAAGYFVRVAADGFDAWNIMQTEDIDVVVSDVDMPRMNGFELTTMIRKDPKFAELPVVLVTALESREDKEQGLRVGANAYVLKSGFNQASLLDIVRRLG